MANLAIKGHPTRGKEVIEILEILGGCNVNHCCGGFINSIYFINENGYIESCDKMCHLDYFQLSLEEFLQKYPYMVGDKVIYHECEAVVTSMEWNGDEVCYTVLHKGIKWQTTVFYLQPYKKETMEEKDEKSANHVFDTEIISFDIAQRDKYELDLQGKFKVVLREGKYYVERIKPQYPKTYEECCKIKQSDHEFYIDTHLYSDKLGSLYKLLICRDAYWKIAGKQMGLDKPWEYDMSKDEFSYAISYQYGHIQKNEIRHKNAILAFPTAEMREAFFENFKELIEACKEFL